MPNSVYPRPYSDQNTLTLPLTQDLRLLPSTEPVIIHRRQYDYSQFNGCRRKHRVDPTLRTERRIPLINPLLDVRRRESVLTVETACEDALFQQCRVVGAVLVQLL